MTRLDPIASATLAKLYIDQGHFTRAAKVIDAVLANQPFQGAALVLRERLRSHAPTSVTCERHDDFLVVRWHKARTRDALRVLVKIITFDDSGGLLKVERILPCEQTHGTHRIPLEAAIGSAAVCLARRTNGRMIPVAVASAVSWSATSG